MITEPAHLERHQQRRLCLLRLPECIPVGIADFAVLNTLILFYNISSNNQLLVPWWPFVLLNLCHEQVIGEISMVVVLLEVIDLLGW